MLQTLVWCIHEIEDSFTLFFLVSHGPTMEGSLKVCEYRRKPQEVVHVLRVPFHMSLNMQYLYFTAKIAARVQNFIPDLNLCVILQLARNLRLFFHHCRTKPLRNVALQATDARDAQRECAIEPAAAAEPGLSQFISVIESLDCSLL